MKKQGFMWVSSLLLVALTACPTPPPILPIFIDKISAGAWHSLALTSDGAVLAWGRNNYGQLGDGLAPNDKTIPFPVLGASGITAISSGAVHSLALKSDGTVLAWGADYNGQLGNNTSLDDKSSPVPVLGASVIIAISAGGFHSLALKSDGTVLAWGTDNYGQLGDNVTLAIQPTPVLISGLSGIVAISAGGRHSLALKNDGTVFAWGYDFYGQLGDDAALTNIPTPVLISGLSSVIAISAGADHSLALKSDNTVLAWGKDAFGQLGNDAALTNIPTPVAVINATGIIAISAGGESSLALKSDNTVLAWGQDDKGQLGNDTALANNPTPVSVSGATGITAISAGGFHSLARKSDGKLLAWGLDDFGQMGNDSATVNLPTPTSVFLP